MTKVEFYESGGSPIIASVYNVGAVPSEGALVNIRKKTWRVVRVTWAVDNAGARYSALRANIDLEEV